MPVSNASDPTSPKTDWALSLTRVFDAPCERVWQAWTQRQHLMHWFCPQDFQTLFAEMDVRVGGRWRAGMRSPDGREYIHSGIYRQVDQPHTLVFTHSWERNDLEPPAETLVTVTLAERDGKTVMTFHQVGFATVESRDSHEHGWTGAFEYLATHLGGGATACSPFPDKPNQASEAPSERQIVISRVFDAPRERVWQACTDPEQVVQWWGPNGFTTTTHEMDVRPGGVWRFTMHGPDGRHYPNRIIFDEVVAPERLSYTHDDDAAAQESVCFQTTLTFETVDGEPGRTRLTLCMTAPTTAERNRIERNYGAVLGGIQHVGRLGEHLAHAGVGHTTTLILALPTNRDMIVSRTFDAPLSVVFDAWTRPELIRRWLYGPAEWPMVECHMEPQVGGAIRYVWRNAKKGQIGLSGVIRQFEPPHRIVHTELFDEDWTGGETVVTTTFDEHEGRTTVTTRVNYNTAKARDDVLAGPCLEGWGQSLDRAAELLASLATESAQVQESRA